LKLCSAHHQRDSHLPGDEWPRERSHRPLDARQRRSVSGRSPRPHRPIARTASRQRARRVTPGNWACRSTGRRGLSSS